MWNIPTKERLDRIPRIYATENVPLQGKLIHLHFFIGGCDWYIAEFDGSDLLWGFAILNNDFEMAEWGYIGFKELRDININGLEIDCELEEFFPIQKASEVDNICRGNRWGKYQNPLDPHLKDLLRQAAMDNVIELLCCKCGGTLRCEPDARESFCFDCKKRVPINNPLIENGLI